MQNSARNNNAPHPSRSAFNRLEDLSEPIKHRGLGGAENVERCRRLAAGVNLPVAGIDLRVTAKGEWYCFEVNPSPGFTYYQDATGQPIAEAIAQFLA